ncbi:MAG: hypothetical protein ICV72_06555, partial [Aldersonia sp.]|nr:hypothetical protein [Aldersonia sp.]
RRTRLVTERDGGRTDAMASLRSQVQLARVDLVHEVGAQVRALNTAVRERVDSAKTSELGEVPTELDALVRRLTDRLDESTGARIEQFSRRVLGAAPPRVAGPVGAPPRISPPQANGRNPIEGRLTIALGASAGVALGRLAIAPLTMIPALDAATVPLTLALGGGAAWWFTRSRGQLAHRARLRQWVSDALVDVKAQLEQRAVSALVEGEAVLADEIARSSARHTALVDGEIESLDAEIRQLGAHRAARLGSCQRDLAVVTDGLRKLRAGEGAEPDRDRARP